MPTHPTVGAVRVLAALVLSCVPVLDLHAQAPAPEITTDARDYLMRALDVMQSRSLHAARLDWSKIRADALQAAEGAKKPADTYPAIVKALEALGDMHSFFRPAGSAASSKPGAVPKLAQEPEGHRIEQTTGYLRIPEFAGRDPKTFAAAILQLIRDVDGHGVCRWIIDLRGNGGGNMWPMLQGLSPILGKEVPGYFAFPGGYRSPWKVNLEATVPYELNSPEPFVAILHDERTASSGEAVAVAFRGKPRTRSFGQPTRGLSTANDSIPLSDGATIFLTIAVFEDRNGVSYGGVLQPDEVAAADAAVSRALEWLRTQNPCHTPKE